MTQDAERGKVSPETRRAETEDALVTARPDRDPTPDEEETADEERVDDDVREHYEEMAERGVEQRGEGRIT